MGRSLKTLTADLVHERGGDAVESWIGVAEQQQGSRSPAPPAPPAQAGAGGAAGTVPAGSPSQT